MYHVSNYILLLLGFLFTFFVPGFIFIETFYPRLTKLQKMPLVMLLSVFLSTYAIYLASMFAGYSRITIMAVFNFFVVWLGMLLIKKRNFNFGFPINHKLSLFLGFIVFLLFLVALYPAIFAWYKGSIVLSSYNWQDGAMHIGIIESISQGNFPPQAPYFAGRPLSYYYFADFHAAILETLHGGFFPRVLVYINPFFSFIFFLSLYSLSYALFHNKRAARMTAILGVFFGNLTFLRFFKDLLIEGGRSNIFSKVISLLSNRDYAADFNGVMQVSPMADYFLQNRPAMVGLPAVSLVILLVYLGFKEKKDKNIFLAGLITAFLIKFQYFAFLVSTLVFIVAAFFFFRSKSLLRKVFLFFIIPFIFLLILFLSNAGGNFLMDLVKGNLKIGGWEKGKNLLWHIKFVLGNFGPAFVLFLFSPIFFLIKDKESELKPRIFLFVLTLVLFSIPYLVSFTIFNKDMFKFFYFMVIPMSLLAGYMLSKLKELKVIGTLLTIFIVLCSTLTSFLVLGRSFLSKNTAYTLAAYNAGMWIRENTPPKSVFADLPSVHSPVDQIGGRLRVISYITWPYSHGFNGGEDNVFKRRDDIVYLYKNAEDNRGVLEILHRYKVNFVLVGPEERKSFSGIEEKFDRLPFLKLVYNSENIGIYEKI